MEYIHIKLLWNYCVKLFLLFHPVRHDIILVELDRNDSCRTQYLFNSNSTLIIIRSIYVLGDRIYEHCLFSFAYMAQKNNNLLNK